MAICVGFDKIQTEGYTSKNKGDFLMESDLYNEHFSDLKKKYKDLYEKALDEYKKSTEGTPSTTFTPTEGIRYYQWFGTPAEGKGKYITFVKKSGKDEYNKTLDDLIEQFSQIDKIKNSQNYKNASATNKSQLIKKVKDEIFRLRDKANLLLGEPLSTAFELPSNLTELLADVNNLIDAGNFDELSSLIEQYKAVHPLNYVEDFDKIMDALELDKKISFIIVRELGSAMVPVDEYREELKKKLKDDGRDKVIPLPTGAGKKKGGRKQLLKNLDKPFKSKKPALSYKDDLNDLYYNSDSSSSSSCCSCSSSCSCCSDW